LPSHQHQAVVDESYSLDSCIDAALAYLDKVTTTTQEKTKLSDQAIESNTKPAKEHHVEKQEKRLGEFIHKTSFVPDTMQSKE